MRQVLSVEQMKHLQELGVDTSGASLAWMLYPYEEGKRAELSLRKYSTFKEPFRKEHCIPAFTLQDIVDLLLKEMKSYTDTYWLAISICDCKEWRVYYSVSDEFDCYEEFRSESLIDAAYETLCWCAENGYVRKEETK